MDKLNIKIRKFPEHNYKAIYFNGKTLRIAINPRKPITKLDYPEFYDVKITDKCTGKCDFCYMDSLPTGKHFDNIIDKVKDYFGKMDENQKPFQVAIGGGNPNQHPDFIELLKTFYELGITPNYTTNGIGLTNEILEATKLYCGGVALSCHPHLSKHWIDAIYALKDYDIKTNLHLIISDEKSINEFISIFCKFDGAIDYFVLLPHAAQGRAKEKEIDYEYLMKQIDKIDSSKIAFGANFHPYLSSIKNTLDISLYDPESMSGFLDMSSMKLYKSSFDLTLRNK